ncbi:MAG: SDR family NAD(P)-dependent oxidoreductase [Pseudomonadota bacterium]
MTPASAAAADGTGLAGRVALVTGGAGGIGRAIRGALEQRGAKVVAAEIVLPADSANCDFARAACTEIHLDVCSKAEVGALVARIATALGGIDLLVNVAGVASFGSAEDLPEEEWDRVIRINLKGTFLCCQAVIPYMKQKRFGRIVNIGSVVGKNGGNARPWLHPDELARAGNVAYGVSKAGVHAMTAFLAKEVAAFGITVNAVAPGPIATEMTANFPESLRSLIPVGRMGTMSDVVGAVLLLASASAGFITGEVLDVNGGIWCD